MRNSYLTVVLAVMVAASLLGAPDGASAQGGEDGTETGADDSAGTSSADEGDKVDPDFKGMVGLGLIGAELGFVVPALAGLHDTWAFITFPIVGAAGGALAGYFLLEKGEGNPEVAVAMLGVSMALVIPATVLTLSATSYDPEDEPTMMDEASRRSALARARTRRLRDPQQMARAAGPGLLRYSPDGVFLGVPAVGPGLSQLPKDDQKAGLTPHPELRVAVLSGSF